jgi:hypothetical protein
MSKFNDFMGLVYSESINVIIPGECDDLTILFCIATVVRRKPDASAQPDERPNIAQNCDVADLNSRDW